MYHPAICLSVLTALRITPALVAALWALLACLAPAMAQNAGRTVMLVDETAVHALGPDMEIFADQTGRLTIDQVSTPEFSKNFTLAGQREPGFGITRSRRNLWSSRYRTSTTGRS